MQDPPADIPFSDPALRGLVASDLPPDEGSGRGFAYEWERTAAQITQQIADIGGGGGSPSFEFTQSAPADTWTITHGLDGFPSVLVIDASGQQLIAEVHYPDDQTVVVNHGLPYSGTAYLRL